MHFVSLFSGLAIVAVPLASAFTIAVPKNPTSGELTEIHWTSTASDPALFDLFITNSTNHFDLKAIVGEGIETDLGTITYQLPALPAIARLFAMGSVGIPTLRRLANIINEAVDNMESVYRRAEMPLPSLNTPFNPVDPAEAVLQDPIVAEAVLNIMAATSQLSATVCSPVVSALNASQAPVQRVSMPKRSPLGGYALHISDATNVDRVLAASPPFAIKAA
ncbi:hypothetical protein MVEN_01840600 [Mycena venus]|uniref:Uncharacterized protein n=1 Tax=Mycena venus TaxID=2733690 RepID=A0A8H7CNH8_9AGAR|nr:hypothetical protein MVEN_01840600 [Mycena venus]